MTDEAGGEGEGAVGDVNDLGKAVDDGWPFGTGNKEESQLEKHSTSASLDVYLINQGNFEVEMSKNELD